MNRWVKLILVFVAMAGGLWFGYAKVLKKLYLEPRAALLQTISTSTATLAQYRANREDHPRVSAELQRFVDRTLGSDFETVDHKLRTRLSRLGENVQLKGIAVDTTKAVKPKDSPAKMWFKGAAYRALRDEPDFDELEGWISGTCSFEQVLRLVDSIEAEPWIKRIDELTLDPKDNGSRFAVKVRLTTLFLPGRPPNPDAVLPPNTTTPDRHAALALANPFRVPTPPKNQPIVDVVQAPGDPPYPYDQWALTGVAQSNAGAEIWLLNRQTQESRRLAVGEKIQDVILVAARGETAEFRLNEQHFLVPIGATLSDRTPVNQ